MTEGLSGSVRRPIGVSTWAGVVRVTQPPGAVWQVSALSTTVIRLVWAITRSGAGSAVLQPGAPAARVALMEARLFQHAKVMARERSPVVVCATAVSTVSLEMGPLATGPALA